MPARDEVFSRLRTALADAPDVAPVPRDYRRSGEHPPGARPLLELLTHRLLDCQAAVHHSDERGLAAAVATALRAGGARPTGRLSIVVPTGLPIGWLQEADVDVRSDDGLSAEDLDHVDGVVTSVAVAVAETGTLVLDGTAGQGRRALTLVPDLHVCVVRAEQVVQTVPEALRVLDPTRPVTWISGPSATSDIELVRVEGVHGPRRLHVVLVA